MPTGTALCSLWLHNGTTWVNPPNIINVEYNSAVNQIGSMSATVYTTTTSLQTLMSTAGTPYRLMNVAATNGFAFNESGGTSGNFVLQQGTLNDPSSEQKASSASSTLSYVWNISGTEIGELIAKKTFDNTFTSSDDAGPTQIAPLLTGTVKSIIATVVSTVNAGGQSGTAGTYLANGTTNDNGPTVSVKFRQENAYQVLMDLVNIGDNATKFPYYLFVRNSYTGVSPAIKCIPMVNYVSSQSAGSYVQPNNTTGVKYSDPTGGVDPRRVIDELTDARSVIVYQENDRIRNAVNVKYSGGGSTFDDTGSSNTGQLQTTFSGGEDATSLGKFGRRESTIYAPWIFDSATAVLYQQTLLGTYSGNPSGIQRVEVTLRKPALFDTSGASTFNANLGDTVALKRKDGSYLMGKYLAVSYTQTGEAITITIGLPGQSDSVASMADVSSTSRQAIQTTNALERVTLNTLAPAGVIVGVANSTANGTILNSASGTTPTLRSADASFGSVSLTPSSSDADSAYSNGYYLVISISPSSLTIDGTTAASSFQEPLNLFLTIWGGNSLGDREVSTGTICIIIPGDYLVDSVV